MYNVQFTTSITTPNSPPHPPLGFVLSLTAHPNNCFRLYQYFLFSHAALLLLSLTVCYSLQLPLSSTFITSAYCLSYNVPTTYIIFQPAIQQLIFLLS
jgi:hypothetical protein